MNIAELELLINTVLGIVEMSHRLQLAGEVPATIAHAPPVLVMFIVSVGLLKLITVPCIQFWRFPVSEMRRVSPALIAAKLPLTNVLVIFNVFEPVPIVRISELKATILPAPDPLTVIPFPEIVTPEVQIQVPGGMITVSPSAAELMAACTALELQEAALTVFANASWPKNALNIKANVNNQFVILILVIPDVPLLINLKPRIPLTKADITFIQSKATVPDDLI